jgi:hypothetical protein
MKKLFSFTFLFLFFLLITNCKKDDPNTDENISGKTEYSGKVNVDKADVTVGIPNVVDVKIPQGAFSGDATFTIKALDLASVPASTDFKMYESFEITSTSGSTFAKNLEIKINYDDTKGEKIARNNGAAFYNETSKKWIPFGNVSVDTIQRILTINTNHLTKLGRYSYSYLVLGYTDWASSGHFNIYWKEPGVMTNKDYTSPYAASHAGTDPHYVQDILLYLNASWTAFNTAKLEIPTSRINVYLDPLPQGTDGVTSFLGKITINEKMAGSPYATLEENLPMVCAHELLHYVQDYYYVELFAQYATKWWMEATATQADRIVWPENTKFESLDPGLDLSLNLARSWDDCLVDPNWYTAGKFLCYMANYRNGTKMSIPEIIKECGKATNVSYYRTIVDNYVKSNLGSAGIGDEFRDFVKCAYDAKGDLKYPAEGKPSAIPALANQKNSILRTKYDVSTNEISVPYLAAGFLKCANNTKENQNVYAKLDKKSAEVDVFAYRSTVAGPRFFIQQMNEKDSIKVGLADSNEWIDFLVVNKTKDAGGSATATFRCEKMPFISSVSPLKVKIGDEITISGFSFGSKASTSDIYFNSIKVNALSADVKLWSETQIVVKVPVGATSGTVSIIAKDVVSNSVNFEIVMPMISSVSPVRAKPGEEITIQGSFFGSDKTKGEVQFTNAIATKQSITAWSDTQIKVNVPALASTGKLKVKVNQDFSNEVNFAIPPIISSLSQTSGSIGDLITIYGSIFGSSGSVDFNGEPVTEIVSWNNSKIEVKVPKNATSGDVVVTVTGEVSNAISFQVFGPQITSLDPVSTKVGDIITIYGSYFGDDKTKGEVFFNEIKASEILSWKNFYIIVKVPLNAISGKVVVRVHGVQSNLYSYKIIEKTPQITSSQYSSRNVGSSLEIYGINFGNDKTNGTVDFNGTVVENQNIYEWTDTRIAVKVPKVKSDSIHVTVNGVRSNGLFFKVIFYYCQLTGITTKNVDPYETNTMIPTSVYGVNFAEFTSDKRKFPDDKFFVYDKYTVRGSWVVPPEKFYTHDVLTTKLTAELLSSTENTTGAMVQVSIRIDGRYTGNNVSINYPQTDKKSEASFEIKDYSFTRPFTITFSVWPHFQYLGSSETTYTYEVRQE